MARRKKRLQQAELPFKRRGGARPGAGRKPNADKAGVSHLQRAALASRFPVHVTVRLRRGLPRLRTKATYKALRTHFARGCDRFGFRLIHYCVLNDHVHLIAEATDRTSLTRGMQGLLIRLAKGLNRLWSRKGSVWSDRYHDRILRTPREVRHALNYVLNNARKHGYQIAQAIDLFASGPWFDGWRQKLTVHNLPSRTPLTAAHTWLLRKGWRRHGLLAFAEIPAG